MSHNDKIYLHMLNIGPITALIAMKQYGCMRLSARIKDLEQKGIKIRRQWVTHINADGEKKRFKEYWLA